ncbi:class IV lanthionine synthetase LanL [Kitasatospora cineracea]|uniref:class IV lanthionine synthetase LanL n=1 Tax=Kitasatospora cineracea TaxID=88074 RepID=UPI0036ABBE59
MAGSVAVRRPWSDDTWSHLNDPRMPAMEHGWKLHVSARPGTLAAVLALVLPVLERHVCHAKWARDPEVLRTLNSGTRNAASVGKAVTVYPAPNELLPLAAELAAALRGREGPPITGDRRLAPDAPVYYRYGPFTGDYRTGRSGRLESVMTGPDGQLFDGLAGTAYRCPPWAADPFTRPAATPPASPAPGASATPTAADTPTAAAGFGGGRYRVTGGIARKAQGNVYRALDLVTGLAVVVKQARAYVAEDADGTDARDRLRNEHAVLTALDGLPGVPRALDYFRHRADEYLVTTDCGSRDLRREVHDHGPFAAMGTDRPHPSGPLAARLLRVLDGAHRRGVVVRDLKPDNVVLDAEGHCHVVDFGISARHGTGPDGSTPGYSGPVHRPGAPALPADDYHALGMTLHFAATGLDPVVLDPDPAVNRERTLACLEFALPGPAHQQFRALIGDLTSPDPATRTAGADRLRREAGQAVHQQASNKAKLTRTGLPRREAARPSRRRPPAAPQIPADLLAEVVEHTVAACVAEAHRIADPARADRSTVPAPVDVYGGSSGLGLELLQHLHRPGVPAAVAALADWTARQHRTLPAGLYCGRTGVDLFLTAAGAPPPHTATDVPDQRPGGGPPEADLIDGAAGTGLGHLLLAHAHPAPAPAATAAVTDAPADRHLAAATACRDQLTTGHARLTPPAAPRPGDAALTRGIAHGDAGVAHFLLAHARATGDPVSRHHAALACARLADATPALLAAATRPGASRRYGSWCRGLAGIGAVLARAAEQLGEPAHRALAERCARACLDLAPRMPLVTQCCGLAGVGDLMLELAPAAPEFHEAAGTVAALVLARSAGPAARPVFPDAGLVRQSFGHATGTPGVLAFLRRLHSPGSPPLGTLP